MVAALGVARRHASAIAGALLTWVAVIVAAIDCAVGRAAIYGTVTAGTAAQVRIRAIRGPGWTQRLLHLWGRLLTAKAVCVVNIREIFSTPSHVIAGAPHSRHQRIQYRLAVDILTLRLSCPSDKRNEERQLPPKLRHGIPTTLHRSSKFQELTFARRPPQIVAF
jgi:hypothetical protein